MSFCWGVGGCVGSEAIHEMISQSIEFVILKNG